METQNMDLNRETAMRLWNKSFGNETTVKDFAGREIFKGAYGMRGSKYGWNVDHILPESRGGKTADHNLVCCHILTNDEKADKFPVFHANGIAFEIVKHENHYEIERTVKKQIDSDERDVNFMDSASGIAYFKKLKGMQNKPRFVGAAQVMLRGIATTAVVDFIEKLFIKNGFSPLIEKDAWNDKITITAMDNDMPYKEDLSRLLDICVLLNTYLKGYFQRRGIVREYLVLCKAQHFQEKIDMYKKDSVSFNDFDGTVLNGLYINSIVYINTEACKKEERDFRYYRYADYDYVFTNLSNNLGKEVSGR